jgi:signal transduction histidine kinase/CheY-like chemotaxis protein
MPAVTLVAGSFGLCALGLHTEGRGLAATPHLSALAAVSEVTEAADISTVPWAVLAAALLATALLAIGALRERRRRVTVEAAMAARTAELSELNASLLRQKQARQRAEAGFRDFAETTSDWLWQTDAELRFTYVSENVVKDSGRPASFYLGKRRDDDLQLDVDPETARRLVATMEARLPFQNHLSQCRHVDGSLWHAKTNGKPILAADGTFLGYRGATANVTAEVEAGQRAEAARKRLVDAIDIMPAGVMIYDSDERLVLANAGVREMFPKGAAVLAPGTTRQAQLEFIVQQGTIAGPSAASAGWVQERMAAFRANPATLVVPFSDGRWFQHVGRKSAEGSTISVIIDVSDLKRVEQELLAAKRQSDESLALLDTLQSAAPIGFAFVDLSFRYVRVNDALAAINGLPARDHIGMTVPDVLPSLWPTLGPIYEGVLEKHAAVVNIEVSGETPAKPGEIRHWLASFYPVRVRDSVIGIGVALIEVTEQRRIEAQLRQAHKMEAIGNLTGGMAHDFNNLLGVIIGNLDLLCESRAGDTEIIELAGDARDAALRGADLTRRLLAFARRQPLQPTRIVVNDVVSAAVKLLSRMLGENIEIGLDLAEDLWPAVVDAAQLEAALANLATNARDAMPAGGSLRIATLNRRLDAEYTARQPYVIPGDYVLIEVSDTGSGMPPEVLSRVFEPFFTTKEHGHGTGLGLSMVYGFIKQSGGHINVYSEIGVGTTIGLYFPRDGEAVVQDVPLSAEPSLRGGNEAVLVVEDNAALRRVAVRQLAEMGYRVQEAENGAEAMERLEADSAIDVLFTDVVMPGGIDGVQLARTVMSRWPQVRVLLTSGFPGSTVNRGRGVGHSMRLLSKPYRKDQLARALREILDRSDESGD